MNLAEIIQPIVEAAPDREALIFDGKPVPYADVGMAAASAAEELARAGVTAGDRVALVDECTLSFVATVLGAAWIGAAAAPMNHRLTPVELRDLRATSGCADVSVAGEEFAQPVRDAFGRPPLTADVVLGSGENPPPVAAVDDRETAVVIFTSGTTGLPKAVPLSHGELVPRVRLFAAGFDPARRPGIALMCLPAVHVGGLVGLLVALAGGNTTVVQRRFDPGEWLEMVEAHRAQRAFLVPAMLRRILDHPDFDTTDLSSLRALAYGAAPASADLVLRAVEALPDVELSNVFGQTETVGAVAALGADDHRDPRLLGSVGKPLPGIEWRIVDPGTETAVTTGAPGELQIRQGDHWHSTGDLVRVDGGGYLWAEGRLSDIINRGGEKVGPAEIEAVLLQHPDVSEVAVAGMPDEELGERIGAAVVASAPGVSVADLVAWCRERLAPWKLPEHLAIVDELPRNDLGKVSRVRIAALIADRGAPTR